MPLYRGFNQIVENSILENPFIKNPRKPLHTKLEVHTFADEWFKEKLGVGARSQCIFCTPDIHEAHKYSLGYQNGCVVEITPIGFYKIIFSENVVDFNDHSHEFDDCPEKIQDWLSAQHYQLVTDINDIPLDLQGEVMLYCESYGAKVLVSSAQVIKNNDGL